ncbi:hypothetical protein SAMN05421736_12464 [Evansella caseinilytica]|uniref:Uncharacterized protein n=1 Tax=Evansella caseinilytica TaxID=1503961 RepID=A0A1H3US23_9BACI|nr:hypothetical protein [Evansella caseinilytica]SDZ64579.1 hypothetical protein SAMN05421736_12464 [Evansella caseinilytica]
MNSYLLLAIIALKGVCLFFCWKAMKMKGKHTTSSERELSDEEARLLQEKMNHLSMQNQQLRTELQELKK